MVLIKTPRWVWLPILFVLMVTMWMDVITDWTYRFSFFYGLVIASATLFKGYRWGLFFCLFCIAFYFFERLWMGRPLAVTVWNTVMESGNFFLIWLPLFLAAEVFAPRRKSGTDGKEIVN